MNPVTDERYWADYDGLQYAKHKILRRYLGGWFPILASRNGRVMYIDCHAGRGRHETGHEGSPVLALKLLLEHRHRPTILASGEVHFYFFENNRANYEALSREIGNLGPLPAGVAVHPYQEDYETALRSAVQDLRTRNQQLAPAFAFVDPYGFSISMELLNELLAFPQCELLINFMYRYVDMAIHHPALEANLDSLFGTDQWRRLRGENNPTKRAHATINLFSEQLRAKYVTHMYMRAANGVLKYVLLHATNHKAGRNLMKDTMWAATPDGSFTANERDNPEQLVLITPNPDLEPLKQQLWLQFAGQQVRMKEVSEWLVGHLYLDKHLHDVLREYRSQGIVEFSDYGSRFAFSRNPLLKFPARRPTGS